MGPSRRSSGTTSCFRPSRWKRTARSRPRLKAQSRSPRPRAATRRAVRQNRQPIPKRASVRRQLRQAHEPRSNRTARTGTGHARRGRNRGRTRRSPTNSPPSTRFNRATVHRQSHALRRTLSQLEIGRKHGRRQPKRLTWPTRQRTPIGANPLPQSIPSFSLAFVSDSTGSLSPA